MSRWKNLSLIWKILLIMGGIIVALVIALTGLSIYNQVQTADTMLQGGSPTSAIRFKKNKQPALITSSPAKARPSKNPYR